MSTQRCSVNWARASLVSVGVVPREIRSDSLRSCFRIRLVGPSRASASGRQSRQLIDEHARTWPGCFGRRRLGRIFAGGRLGRYRQLRLAGNLDLGWGFLNGRLLRNGFSRRLGNRRGVGNRRRVGGRFGRRQAGLIENGDIGAHIADQVGQFRGLRCFDNGRRDSRRFGRRVFHSPRRERALDDLVRGVGPRPLGVLGEQRCRSTRGQSVGQRLLTPHAIPSTWSTDAQHE